MVGIEREKDGGRRLEADQGGCKHSNNHAAGMQGPKDTISNQNRVLQF